MPTHIDTAVTRYEPCGCLARPAADGGARVTDPEANGNITEQDTAKMKTALARAQGVRDTDGSPRVVEALKAAKARGVRPADYDALTLTKRTEQDPETKQDVQVWEPAPARCPQHGNPVGSSSAYNYIVPDPEPEISR